MSNDLKRVTKMIAQQMAQLSASKDKSQEILGIFMGLGLGLGHCYTTATGKPFNSIKPVDMVKWALELPLDRNEVRVHLQ